MPNDKIDNEKCKGLQVPEREPCPDFEPKVDLSKYVGQTPGEWAYRYLQQSTGSTPEHTRRIAIIEDCSEAPERAGTGRTGNAIAKVDGPVTRHGGVEFDGNTMLIAAAPEILAYARELEADLKKRKKWINMQSDSHRKECKRLEDDNLRLAEKFNNSRDKLVARIKNAEDLNAELATALETQLTLCSEAALGTVIGKDDVYDAMQTQITQDYAVLDKWKQVQGGK